MRTGAGFHRHHGRAPGQKRFTRLRDIELRVGALPSHPNGLMGYSFTWSPAGVINEYINDAEVIHNGVRKMVPSLDGIETINIEGQEFEAFTTSGGLGTLCETLVGKVDTLNYKTIRYPVTQDLCGFFVRTHIKRKNFLTGADLTEAKPPVSDDVVYVYAVVEGWDEKNQLKEKSFIAPITRLKSMAENGARFPGQPLLPSLLWLELVASKKIQTKGFVRQEEIPFDLFTSTKWGIPV